MKAAVAGSVVATAVGLMHGCYSYEHLKRIEVERISQEPTLIPQIQENVDGLKKIDAAVDDLIAKREQYNSLIRQQKEAAAQSSALASTNVNSSKLGEVMGEIDWASKQLNIPSSYILVQALMESGNLNETALQNNNIFGIGGRANFAHFGTLHEGTEKYVEILSKHNVVNISDFDVFMNRLGQSGYYGNQSVGSYESAVLANLQSLDSRGDGVIAYLSRKM